MRDLVHEKIKQEWSHKREEGFQAACHYMGWLCEQDYDYESKNPTLFAVKLSEDEVHVVEQGNVNADFDYLLSKMDDHVLLRFWEDQLCLKYR